MSIEVIIIIAILIVTSVILLALYINNKGKKELIYHDDYTSIDDVVEAVKEYMVEIVKEDYSASYSKEEFDRRYNRQARIIESLKQCTYGIERDKSIVIDLIKDFIDENVSDESVSKILGLDDESEPSDHTMLEIILYKYKKRYGKDALSQWIIKNNFDKERRATGSLREQDKAYFVTVDDLQQSYMEENIHLSKDEKRDVLAILVYQLYKGFGIIDTVREMNVDGMNFGTSGSILSTASSKTAKMFRASRSFWLYFHGKYIHLRFMDFGSEAEVQRVINLIIRYNNPGALTAKRGYIVNTMYDKSRVLALRPPASEYWAVFIRKFTLKDVSTESLIIKPYTHKGDVAVKFIEFLMRGQVTCGVTGRQGSGKTTLMTAMITYIDPRFNIRVLEMAPELYLRELYSTRNILSAQETYTVSASELQDAFKKSDAAVSLCGEVATDELAAKMIQFGMTASIFTIFSHHANTPKDLVLTLRNSIVNAGGFSNMETAEKQVTDVVKFDVHLDYTADGKRYIADISEIVQLETNIPYPKYDETDGTNSMNRITTEYYQRKTDRIAFKVRKIMHYDLDTDTYICDQRISAPLENKMLSCIDAEIRDEFKKFILENWGVRPEDDDYEENLFTDNNVVAHLKSDDVSMNLPKAHTGEESSLLDEIQAKEDRLNKEVTEELADEFNIGLFD